MRAKAAFYREIAEDGQRGPFLDLISYHLFSFYLLSPF